jgi:CubicO group peptidase (beta-lactamase class C family)
MKLTVKILFNALVILTFLISPACVQTKSLSNKISTPPHMSDGWQTGKIEDAGLDSLKLLKLLDRIKKNYYPGIHSILIVKDGNLVFEEYFPGYKFKYDAKEFKGEWTDFDPNTIHNLASVTKSVTALLFGIALDKGFIRDVNKNVFDFFPQYSIFSDDMKSQITLHHLLTMTSGLEWNEQDIFYSEAENDIIQLFIVSDPLKYILSKPVVDEPGTKWNYNGGGTNLIGEIIHSATGMPLDEFAKKHLFDPLEIKHYKWININPAVIYASGDLKLRPRDMAKLGYLVLNDGVWNGNRIISSDWIRKMVQEYVSFSKLEGYGCQWWLKKYKLSSKFFNSYYASGWGGQKILIFPELNAVIVFTCGNYTKNDPTHEIIHRYLLPSINNNLD